MTTQLIVPGDAGFADVLSGKKFSAGTNYNATGTMPNNGAVAITPSTANQTIPQGYHNGSGVVEGDLNLVASNIKSGVTIFDVAGNVIEASGNAGAAQVLTGYSASNSSGGFSGSMPNRGSPTYTPGTSNQGISYGYYGGGTVEGDSNLVAANILSGKSIFNVTGNVIARGFANGNVTSSSTTLTFTLSGGTTFGSYYVTVSGIGFLPTTIIVWESDSSQPFTVLAPATPHVSSGYIYYAGASGTVEIDGTNCYVNNGAFQFPTSSSNYGCYWVAYK